MEKVYLVKQLDQSELSHEMIYASSMYYYYASTKLEDVEDMIKNNITDIWETVYTYVALVTVDLNSIGATSDPIRIFEYDRETDTYNEIECFNMFYSKEFASRE